MQTAYRTDPELGNLPQPSVGQRRCEPYTRLRHTAPRSAPGDREAKPTRALSRADHQRAVRLAERVIAAARGAPALGQADDFVDGVRLHTPTEADAT